MNNKSDGKKPTMAERATAVNRNLVLRDFTICDPGADDNEMFTLGKKFADGSEIEWRIAMPMKAIVRLCKAEGIDLGDGDEHVFRKAPIRVAAWSYDMYETFCYAYCDFPGLDAQETDLESVETPKERPDKEDEE